MVCRARGGTSHACTSRTDEYQQLQAKLLKSYKRLSLQVSEFDDSLLPRDLAVVQATLDLPLLRLWSKSAREKWIVVNRVVSARSEHHSQFYAGGDWGHNLFVETL